MSDTFTPRTAAECAEAGCAVYNPHDRPIDELPFIYGFNNGGSPGWFSGQLIAEDGTGLGGHICSHEGWMVHDLGILVGTRSDRHETFREHYPDGYVMDFVSYADVKKHPALMRAFELNDKLREAAEAEATQNESKAASDEAQA